MSILECLTNTHLLVAHSNFMHACMQGVNGVPGQNGTPGEPGLTGSRGVPGKPVHCLCTHWEAEV